MTKPLLDIKWDPVKAQKNVTKHDVTFAQASTVLLDPLALTIFDAAHSKAEERWFTIGQSSSGRLLAISHTYETVDTDLVRVRLISAREATRRERLHYENEPR